MATLAVTIDQQRVLALAGALKKAAHEASYKNGVTATLTIDNAPSTGTVSVVFSSGTTFIV